MLGLPLPPAIAIFEDAGATAGKHRITFRSCLSFFRGRRKTTYLVRIDEKGEASRTGGRCRRPGDLRRLCLLAGASLPGYYRGRAGIPSNSILASLGARTTATRAGRPGRSMLARASSALRAGRIAGGREDVLRGTPSAMPRFGSPSSLASRNSRIPGAVRRGAGSCIQLLPYEATTEEQRGHQADGWRHFRQAEKMACRTTPLAGTGMERDGGSPR